MAEPEYRIFTRDALVFLGLTALGFALSLWFAGLLLPFLLVGALAGLLITLAAMRISFANVRGVGNYLLLANVLIFILAKRWTDARSPGAVQDAFWACIVQYVAGYAVARYLSLWIAFGGGGGEERDLED